MPGVIYLLFVTGCFFGVPVLSGVNVTCDSYSVLVDWNFEGFSPDAEFILEVVPNIPLPEKVQFPTRSRSYNISKHLQDTGYNLFIVKVTARNSNNETKSENSPKFTFDDAQNADIKCELEFPTIDLIPGDHQLTVKFRNPLQLYRHTPALRNITDRDQLRYEVISDEPSIQKAEQECRLEDDTCESNVLFPKEKEHYCITVSGWIRHTKVKENRKCYSGSLKPSIPITVYIIPLLVLFIFTLIMVILCKLIPKKMKKEDLTKFPPFLVNKDMHLILPLKMEKEPVVEKLLFIPVTKIPLIVDTTGSTAQPETRSSQSLDSCVSLIGENSRNESDGDELEETTVHEFVDPYTNAMNMSDYDCAHCPI
ncbi:interferon gamma receptor 1 [Hoplias malabaricus]|uniref:interferon gamma receptor 1 n=1 Tax=Hoplias malabaricus TaxID=27720 RepID=UPI003461B300